MTVTKLALILATFGTPLAADDYWVGNLGSYHFDRSKPLNETNLGAGFGRMGEYCGGEVGAYWNSHDKLAAYGFGICETKGTFKAGLFAGLASGYQDIPDNYHGIIPVAGLQLTAGNFQVKLNPEVAFFQVRFDIE